MKKHAEIYDLNLDYETDYRNVKHPRLEFKTGRLLLVLPKNYEKENELIEKHKDWIYKKTGIIKLAKKDAGKTIIEHKDNEELKDFVHSQVKKFSKEIGAKPKEIRFMKLKSKWGSCSIKKRLTFNILLKYLPESLIKYIVFHETVHLKEKNHNSKFWRIVSLKFKNYQKNEKELLVYWFLVQDKIK